MPWTFYNSNGQRLSTATTLIDNLDIDGATDIGAAIADADLFIIDDNAGGTNRKTAASRLKTYIGSVSQAVQADIEAETNEDTYIPPDLAKHIPGATKLWGYTNSGGTLQSPDYNVDSITDVGTGIRTIVIGTDFSDADYSIAVQIRTGDSVGTHSDISAIAVGSFTWKVYNNSNDALQDSEGGFQAIGDQ